MNDSEGLEATVAGEPMDDSDARILEDLASALSSLDPPPTHLADEVKFRLTVAALEADVAEMVATSPELAGARGTTYERASSVTFSSEALSAMVTIEAGEAGWATISGWTSQGDVEIELRERSRSRTVTSDGLGRFTFTDVARGLVHFVFRLPGGTDVAPVITPAIEI
jgi:hypothetical protein